jgi:hypothetical protein
MYIVVVCYLNFLFSLIAKLFLVRKTNRTKLSMSVSGYIDLALVAVIILWVYQRAFLGIFDPANNF